METQDKEEAIKLTAYDKIIYNFTRLGDLNTIGVGIIDSSDKTVQVDRTLMKKALYYLIERHPLMRSHLESNDENTKNAELYYRIEEKFNLNYLDRDYDEDDLNCEHLTSRGELTKKLEKFNSREFEYFKKCKLWRIALYSFVDEEEALEEKRLKHAIVIVMPLFLTDGLNICTIIIELVNILNSLSNQTECLEMKEKLQVSDNMYTILEERHLFTDKHKAMIDEMHASDKRLDFKYSNKFKCNNERGLKINIFRIDKETTRRVIEMAKARNLKLTGVVAALIIYTINDLYEANKVIFPKDVCFGVSANLRFRAYPKIDYNLMRKYTAFVLVKAFYPDFGLFGDLWRDAKYLNELIKEASDFESGAAFYETHNFNDIIYMNKTFEIIKDKEKLISLFANEISYDLVISNCGKYVFDEKKPSLSKPFEIDEIYFCDSFQSFPGTAVYLSYWNDELQFTISTNKSTISSCFVDQMINFLIENLRKLDF
jgi:hypothetical protein